jgi:hypothetical protein
MDPFQEIRLGHDKELRDALSEEDLYTVNEHRQSLLHDFSLEDLVDKKPDAVSLFNTIVAKLENK